MPTIAEACGWTEDVLSDGAVALVHDMEACGLNPVQAVATLATALTHIGDMSPELEKFVEQVMRNTLDALDELRATRAAGGTPPV